MEKIYAKARAKINLTLEVLDKRQDNYHNIKSVFQKINLYDEIYINKINSNEFQLQTNIKELNNNDNIIYKAYTKLKEKYKSISGIKVVLNKKIPTEAGLAGGSTDCATFLLCMNRLFNLKLTKLELEDIGKNLGADVVPCFYNTAVLAEGIGDIITKIDTDFKYYILVIKPNISCSTSKMYKKLHKKARTYNYKSSDEVISAIKHNNIDILANNLYNVFEDVVDERTIIQDIKSELIKNGSLGSLMTGSGSCVFGLFKDKESAKSAYNKLKEKYQIYICTSYNSLKEKMF